MNAAASAELLKLANRIEALALDAAHTDLANEVRDLAESLNPAQVSDGGAVAWREPFTHEVHCQQFNRPCTCETHPSPSGAQVVTDAMVEKLAAHLKPKPGYSCIHWQAQCEIAREYLTEALKEPT